MKKLLVFLGGLVVLILIAAILIPVIFKDDIKKAIDGAVAENINANVFYDPDGLSLTLINNFPNFTLGLENFGISGKDEFEKDTLVSVGSFEIIIDLMSVISGDQITINAITLDQPKILVLVLPDGKANYDIAMPAEEEDVTLPSEDGSSAFNIGIKKWEIINGDMVYADQTMNFYTSVLGINHTGSGDFTQALFDLTTNTTVDDLSLGFEGVEYMSGKTANIDLILSMDLDNMKFTFKENTIKVNDFGFGFDGYVSMPGEDIDMDITYNGKDISIKSILSLIPGDYQTYLEGVSAEGNINFDGFVKGKYNDTLLPTVNSKLEINNGSISYAEYPIPIEEINVSTELNVPGENMDDMLFNMNNFSMLVDGESVTSKLMFKNLANYTWDFSLNGNLDLEKILKIVPIEGTELKGKIISNFTTSGNMGLIEAEKYDKIPAKGNMTIRNFYFRSIDLPQGFEIYSSRMSFSPKIISLDQFDAMLGNSDMQMDGTISNYIGFALDSTQVLKGNLNFASNKFDLNEWMTDEEVSEEEVEDTTALEVVKIPENIHFVMKANMKKIQYDNMPITDLVGNIIIKDGGIKMEDTGFDMLGGAFTLAGSYNTAKVENPTFDFDFGIKDLSIPVSYKTFNTIQTLAPIAKNVDGKFSTNFKIGGALGQDMMPLYDQLYGNGLVKIAEAALSGGKLTSAVSSVTKLGGASDKVSLKDVIMETEIKDGRLHVKPFDINFGGKKTTISGSNGADGSIDYIMKMNVPAGAIGDAANNALASLTGIKSAVGKNIKLNLKVTGSYDSPKVGLAGTEAGESNSGNNNVTAAAKDQAKQKLAEEKAKAEAAAKAELEKKKKEAEEKAKKLKEEAEAKAKAEAERLKKEAEEKAKNALKGLFKKKN